MRRRTLGATTATIISSAGSVVPAASSAITGAGVIGATTATIISSGGSVVPAASSAITGAASSLGATTATIITSTSRAIPSAGTAITGAVSSLAQLTAAAGPSSAGSTLGETVGQVTNGIRRDLGQLATTDTGTPGRVTNRTGIGTMLHGARLDTRFASCCDLAQLFTEPPRGPDRLESSAWPRSAKRQRWTHAEHRSALGVDALLSRP